MPAQPLSLEYEEEDLFGSDDESNALQSALLASQSKIKPIPYSAAASSSLASTSKNVRSAVTDAEYRLAELRGRRRGLVEEAQGVGRGVSTLGSYCLSGEEAYPCYLLRKIKQECSNPSERIADMGYRRDGISFTPYFSRQNPNGSAVHSRVQLSCTSSPFTLSYPFRFESPLWRLAHPERNGLVMGDVPLARLSVIPRTMQRAKR